MSDSTEDRLRLAIVADGRSLSEIGGLAGVIPSAMTRFVKDGSRMGMDDGHRLAAVVGLVIGQPTETPALQNCNCGKPIEVPTECRDCRIAKKRTTPGTGLAIRGNDRVPPVTHSGCVTDLSRRGPLHDNQIRLRKLHGIPTDA